jgi:hypothetical protein
MIKRSSTLGCMNKLYSNPNIRRFGLPLAVTAAMIGAACTKPDSKPTPPPSASPSTATSTFPMPACAVKVEKVEGLTATFSLDIANGSEEGKYDVEKAQYAFGDGATEDNGSPERQSHTYPHVGTFAVTADMVMDVASRTVGAPVSDGAVIHCTLATLTVK